MSQATIVSADDLIPLAQSAKLFNSRQPPHQATIFRWATRGCPGVKLEARRIGGLWFTTAAAVRQFVNGCNAPTTTAPAAAPTTAPAEMGLSEAEIDKVLGRTGKVRTPRTVASAKRGKAGAK